MLKAVIFDVDGTLVDSNDLHVQAWQEAFGLFGKVLSARAIHQQIGKGGDQLVPVFLSDAEVERFGSALQDCRGKLFLREYLPRVKPFPGVRELFLRLRAAGLRIALASSSPEREVQAHERLLGIGDLLATVTSADDADHSKPCPDIFVAALAGLRNVAPAEAVVVGDTPYDAIAARRAGMRTIAVLSGGFREAELREAGAVEVHRDIAELLRHYDRSLLATAAPRDRT